MALALSYQPQKNFMKVAGSTGSSTAKGKLATQVVKLSKDYSTVGNSKRNNHNTSDFCDDFNIY